MIETQVPVKFRVKADLALFEAVQANGRLSEEKIAQRTGIPSTTVHYGMERIRKREFFDVKAVPALDKFPEIPLAVIGFANVHPMKIEKVKEECLRTSGVLQCFHSEKDIVVILTAGSGDALTAQLFTIMGLLEDKPSVYITSPVVAKYQVTLPDTVLEQVYADLPDRRFRV